MKQTDMQRLAIIGSGISGLGAAYYLRDQYDITIYEAGGYVGGHTNTVMADGIPIDTGFIVYNETTYPNLTRLFAELNVPTHESDMSFGMYNQNSGVQFSGQNYTTLFGEWRNVLRPSHWRLLWQANYFNEHAPLDLDAGRADVPLIVYLRARGYDDHFIYNFSKFL